MSEAGAFHAGGHSRRGHLVAYTARFGERKSVASRWAGQTSNLVGVASNPWWVRLPYSSASTSRSDVLAVRREAPPAQLIDEGASGVPGEAGESHNAKGQRDAPVPSCSPSH